MQIEKSQYKSFREWYLKNPSAYQAARKSGLLPKLCKDFGWKINISKKWTLVKCKKIAILYKKRTDWYRKNSSSYYAALKNGWHEECCKHMPVLRPNSKNRTPGNVWNFWNCKKEALKYSTLSEWSRKSNTSYNKAKMMPWREKICTHMKVSKFSLKSLRNGKVSI